MENKNKDLGVIEVLKLGFLHCGFISRDPQAIANLIMRKIEETMSHLFKHRVIKVEVEKTNTENHDKITLIFDDESKVETMWEWSESVFKNTMGYRYFNVSEITNIL